MPLDHYTKTMAIVSSAGSNIAADCIYIVLYCIYTHCMHHDTQSAWIWNYKYNPFILLYVECMTPPYVISFNLACFKNGCFLRVAAAWNLL